MLKEQIFNNTVDPSDPSVLALHEGISTYDLSGNFNFETQKFYDSDLKSVINSITDDFYAKYLGKDRYWDRK